MQRFEYKVVPAPKKGEKAKAAKTTPERFAQAMMSLMNALGADGWEYLRADTLPCEERVGLTGSKTQFQNMLVFRRVLSLSADQAVPTILQHLSAVPLSAPRVSVPLSDPTSPAEAGTDAVPAAHPPLTAEARFAKPEARNGHAAE